MKKQFLVTTVVSLLGASISMAAPIAPTGTHNVALTQDRPFGGGTNEFGQPNVPYNDVTIATGAPAGLTLALGAHLRNIQPGTSLSDNDNGTYFATAGNQGSVANPRATWNFNFFIENTGSLGLGEFTYVLSYGTDGSGLRSFDPLAILDNNPTGGFFSAGNSENLGFIFGGSFTGTGILGAAIEFNPEENNVTYAFQLEAFQGSTSVAKAAINVQVGDGGPGHTVPDAGSTLALMGAAFVGIAGLRRKFNA